VQQVRRYYPAPGTSLLGKLGKGLLFVASAMSQAAAADQQARGGAYASFDYNPFIKERMLGMVQASIDFMARCRRGSDITPDPLLVLGAPRCEPHAVRAASPRIASSKVGNVTTSVRIPCPWRRRYVLGKVFQLAYSLSPPA
jgi:hypothetical protein